MIPGAEFQNLKRLRIAEALGVCVPELYPEGMQAMPILEWMESKGIPIVSGPHEEEQADPFDDDPYDHPVQPADVEKMAKWLVHQKELLDSITNDFAFLNDEGQEEAAKRRQELTGITPPGGLTCCPVCAECSCCGPGRDQMSAPLMTKCTKDHAHKGGVTDGEDRKADEEGRHLLLLHPGFQRL